MKGSMDLYQGITQFDSLYRRAFWKKLTGALKNHQNRLFPLEAWREITGSEEHYQGIQPVPIRKIIGTENRFQDFDREFLPLTRKDRHRWAKIHNLYTREQPFPPVALLKIGDFYFVRDGHHRISVAKSQNAEYIDAEVIEIKVPPLPGVHSPEEFFHLQEERLFLAKTGLKDVKVTILGGYLELLRLIQCFQCSSCPNKGETETSRCLPWEEAVRGWYQKCYRQAIDIIKENPLLRKMKNRTPADFYLWTLYNLHLLRKAACFVPSSPHFALRHKPSSLLPIKKD